MTARLLRLLRPHLLAMAGASFLGFLTVGSGVGLMTVAGWLIATAALQPHISVLSLAVLGVRVFGTFRGVFRYAERLLAHHVTFAVLARVRTWAFASLEPHAPAGLLDHRTGDLLGRVVGDVEALEEIFARAVHPPLVALITGVALWGLLGPFDVRIAGVLTAFLLVAGVVLPLSARWLTAPIGRQATAARAELDALLVDGLHGAADLAVFGRDLDHRARVDAAGDSLLDLQARLGRITAAQAAISGLLATLAGVGALGLGIPHVREGSWEGVSLAAVVLAVLAAFEATNPLPAALAHLDRALASARRVFELADAPLPVPVGGDAPPESSELVFTDLVHRYGDGPAALDGISLRVSEGSRVAIVGESGAGKSTLVSLLLRFWDWESGSLTLGGVDLRALDPEAVRQRLAVVPQRGVLFGRTVRENLQLARPGATDAELAEAVRQAAVLDVVEALPDGWGTWIGEHGTRLSGGERQRLAVARALLRDAPILLLDEPTAHLDAAAAAALHATLLRVSEGRTTVLITHRLLGLEAMDQVVVLGRGRVLEAGTATELLGRDGWFARTWRLQREVAAVELA